jgi:hypothetical protein
MPKWANYYKKHHLNHNTHSLKVLNLLLGEDNICSPTYTEIIFWVSWCVCMYLQRLIYACIYVYSTYWMHASHMTILVQEHLYKSHAKTPNPHVHTSMIHIWSWLIFFLLEWTRVYVDLAETEMGSISSGNCKRRHGIYTFNAFRSYQLLGGWAPCHHIEQNALCPVS